MNKDHINLAFKLFLCFFCSVSSIFQQFLNKNFFKYSNRFAGKMFKMLKNKGKKNLNTKLPVKTKE